MIQKEINEIRRHLNSERACTKRIYGAFVNKNKEIISRLDYSFSLMLPSEKEKYMSLFKKVLSGGLGKCMVDISFSTQQVADSPEHKLLMDLKNSSLENDEAREKLISDIIQNINLPETNYVILLAADTYDIPFKTSDEDESGDSLDMFSYIICAICPVKDGKPELAYNSEEQEFHTFLSPQLVSSPAVGFMFPSFDDRSTNIYNAMLYTKDTSVSQEGLIDALFKTKAPLSAPEQREIFTDALTNTLKEECSYDVVQSIHEQINERIIQHKESHEPTPLEFTPYDVGKMLTYSGVQEEKIEAFCKKCEEDFGENAVLIPTNIIESKKFKIETPQVKITVDPEYTYSVETRVIDGRKYLLIPADDAVCVNGINIKIPKEE